MGTHIMKQIKFSINNWEHLYSLQQAVVHSNQLTGRTLGIRGRVKNSAFLNHRDTGISITFVQLDSTPSYPLHTSPANTAGNTPDIPVLGTIALSNQQLSTEISVDRAVFEELRKNLMEYADIEGIHIMVTLGLCCKNEHKAELSDAAIWAENQSLEIVQLDYAMKGDA